MTTIYELKDTMRDVLTVMRWNDGLVTVVLSQGPMALVHDEQRKLAAALDPEAYSEAAETRTLLASVSAERAILAAQLNYDCDAYGAFLDSLDLVSEGEAGPPRADQVIPVLSRELERLRALEHAAIGQALDRRDVKPDAPAEPPAVEPSAELAEWATEHATTLAASGDDSADATAARLVVREPSAHPRKLVPAVEPGDQSEPPPGFTVWSDPLSTWRVFVEGTKWTREEAVASAWALVDSLTAAARAEAERWERWYWSAKRLHAEAMAQRDVAEQNERAAREEGRREGRAEGEKRLRAVLADIRDHGFDPKRHTCKAHGRGDGSSAPIGEWPRTCPHCYVAKLLDDALPAAPSPEAAGPAECGHENEGRRCDKTPGHRDEHGAWVDYGGEERREEWHDDPEVAPPRCDHWNGGVRCTKREGHEPPHVGRVEPPEGWSRVVGQRFGLERHTKGHAGYRERVCLLHGVVMGRRHDSERDVWVVTDPDQVAAAWLLAHVDTPMPMHLPPAVEPRRFAEPTIEGGGNPEWDEPPAVEPMDRSEPPAAPRQPSAT